MTRSNPPESISEITIGPGGDVGIGEFGQFGVDPRAQRQADLLAGAGVAAVVQDVQRAGHAADATARSVARAKTGSASSVVVGGIIPSMGRCG